MNHRTSNGVEIVSNLRVFSHELKWGTVTAPQFTRGGLCDPGGQYFDGWFEVLYDTGTCVILNGDRMSTRDTVTFTTDPNGK